MPVLYLVEQGATLRKESDTLVVSKEGKQLQQIPAIKVEQVVIFGNVNITTPVIHYLLAKGIDCVFCSSTGRYHGRLISTESRYGLLRQSQMAAAASLETKLGIAKAMVRGKLMNVRTMLQRYNRELHNPDMAGAIEGLEELLQKADKVADVPSLLGIEGYAASLYYPTFRQLLQQDLGFVARVRRPPKDPVNSLLSFGYTLLVYSIQAAIRTVGLDPFIGFLHATEYSRPSLALDLMEEFRPIIVDSIVLRAVNTRMVTAEDFQKAEDSSGMVLLKQETIKKFLGLYEERVQTMITHPHTNTRANYRRCFELQARQLARVLTGQEKEYRPFVVR